MEKPTQLIPRSEFILPEGRTLEVTNSAQLELRLMGGPEGMLDWVNANGARFREIISDPERNLVERLANEDTHAEAINEIKEQLYH